MTCVATKKARQRTSRLAAITDLVKLRRDPLGYFLDRSKNEADVFIAYAGLQPITVLNHPDHIARVFATNKNNYEKSEFFQRVYEFLGEGLFTTEGEVWQAQRRTVQPSVTGPNLKKLTQVLTQSVTDCISRWDGYAREGQLFDLRHECMMLTLDVALRCFFGTRLENEQEALYAALATLLRETERRMWSLFRHSNLLNPVKSLKYKQALKQIDAIILRLIDELGFDATEEPTLFARLARKAAKDGLTPTTLRRLRDETVSLFVASHETTANALLWAWIELASKPKWRARLVQEAYAIRGQDNPSFETLRNLPVAEASFKEALRRYPPVWTFSRTAIQDDMFGQHVVKAGSTVMLSPYILQHHKDFWSNPLQWDPNRFLERNEPKERWAYFPFGGGMHTCLGNRFSMLEGTAALAMVAARYELAIPNAASIRAEAMITVRPVGPVMAELKVLPKISRGSEIEVDASLAGGDSVTCQRQ